jgi:Transglycosylase SLT domain
LSIPRTRRFRHASRKPAGHTFAVTGTAVAAAALIAVGLATATSGALGATTPPGAAHSAHSGIGIRRLARVSPDRPASSRAEGGSPAPHRAAGVSPVTAAGRTILASGLPAGLAIPARSRRSRPAHSGNQAPSSPHTAKAGHRTQLAGPSGPCATSTLHWWICAAEHTLEQAGVSRGRLSTNAAYIVVKHESGANPRAFNGWDSNAAAGHPSEGIAQVIGPTFRAYALAGHHNIWNPVDNMIAAFRYAISRYGSMNNIPGVVNVRQGGSYIGY